MRNLTGLDELAQPRLEPRPDAAQVTDAAAAHQVGDGSREGPDQLRRAAVCAHDVVRRAGEVEQRRVTLQCIRDGLVVGVYGLTMALFVIPFRYDGKTRLGDPEVALAMFMDVRTACEQLGEVLVCDGPGGQGPALAATLAGLEGPVAIVNADLPCVTPYELIVLVEAAPALVAAPDGTTNALALADARDFQPLYGPGSAERFGLRRLDLRGLRDDVDTREDLLRLARYVGPSTRSAMLVSA